jgi:hypothetical protein
VLAGDVVSARARGLRAVMLCLVVAGCGTTGGAQVATVPHGQDYWDSLSVDHSEPRVDYPGPAIHGNTGMGSGM